MAKQAMRLAKSLVTLFSKPRKKGNSLARLSQMRPDRTPSSEPLGAGCNGVKKKLSSTWIQALDEPIIRPTVVVTHA
jgi:hypothetical protein